MKNRIIIALATATLLATAAFADGPGVRRTIIVKDGKVVTDNVEGVDDELPGGKRAYLGVSLTDISPELREHFGATKENGVLVESVEDGSPADKAGLQVGDVIISVEGKDVHWSGDSRRAIRDILVGVLTSGIEKGVFDPPKIDGRRDLKAMAMALLDQCTHISMWYIPGRQLDEEQMATLYAEMALRSVGAVEK
jgi:hypothetical protein